MNGRLKDKVIVIAGGAGGIGGGLARRYAGEGASVVIGDLDRDGAEATADAVRAAGGEAIATRLDGGDDASIGAAVALAVDRYGGLDGFHANYASFADSLSGDVLETPLEDYDEMMRVNARGFLLCTRHALRAFLARGGGSILYTSSGAVYIGETVRCAYAMSKEAGHALMRHVALRFGPQNIRANTIAPGVVSHARFEAVMDPDDVAAMRQRTLLRRLGAPGDIAAMGALLLSDDGAFITGQVINVDGGASMRA